MKLRKALLLVMRKWNITGYRLSQITGIDRSSIAKIIRGDQESGSSDLIEKLAEALEKIEPMANDAFYGLLRRPDCTYPDFPKDLVDIYLEKESSELAREYLELFDEEGLIDRTRLKKLKEKLASLDKDLVTPVEDYLARQKVRKRHKQRKANEIDQEQQT